MSSGASCESCTGIVLAMTLSKCGEIGVQGLTCLGVRVGTEEDALEEDASKGESEEDDVCGLRSRG